MYLAVRCVGGKERQAIESFERYYAAEYGENIKLHLFERNVVSFLSDGKSKQVSEKLYPNYIFAEITDIDYEDVYHVMKNVGYVQDVYCNEVTEKEFATMLRVAAGDKVEIAEPKLFYDSDERNLRKLIKAQKALERAINRKIAVKLMARIQKLQEQKRRYQEYLRALPEIIGHRIIKGKRAVYEFSQELLQVVEGRDYPEHHTGGRGDPVDLVIRLAQAST